MTVAENGNELQVLHLITRFKSGGAEKTVQRTLEAINSTEDGNKFNLYLGTGSEYEEEKLGEIESIGVQTKVFDSLRHYNLLTAPVAVIAIAWYLYNNDIDILHTHSTEAGIIGRISAGIAGTEIVIHEIHGDPISEDRNHILNWFILQLERFCANLTHVFVAKSENIKETYLSRNLGTRERYQIIRHGVDVREYSNAGKKSDLGNQTTLLYVGRITNGKGVEDLIEAIDIVARERLTLLIAGKGSARDKIEMIVEEKDLTGSVQFLGYRDDIPELMATADALVLPSYREGTPRVITEALAAGTPVVSTKIAGIPDQVRDGETGVLIEPGDVQALADTISDLSENPEKWGRMGENGVEDAQKCRIEKIKNEWRKFYRDIISE